MFYKSKKFWAAIAGLVGMVISYLTGLDETTITGFLVVIVSYILGQGIADHGKEKAKVEQEESQLYAVPPKKS